MPAQLEVLANDLLVKSYLLAVQKYKYFHDPSAVTGEGDEGGEQGRPPAASSSHESITATASNSPESAAAREQPAAAPTRTGAQHSDSERGTSPGALGTEHMSRLGGVTQAASTSVVYEKDLGPQTNRHTSSMASTATAPASTSGRPQVAHQLPACNRTATSTGAINSLHPGSVATGMPRAVVSAGVGTGATKPQGHPLHSAGTSPLRQSVHPSNHTASARQGSASTSTHTDARPQQQPQQQACQQPPQRRQPESGLRRLPLPPPPPPPPPTLPWELLSLAAGSEEYGDQHQGCAECYWSTSQHPYPGGAWPGAGVGQPYGWQYGSYSAAWPYNGWSSGSARWW